MPSSSAPLLFGGPVEGLVVVFDEPRRAPVLGHIADERGVVRDAFSALDRPFDEKHPELCVLSFDGRHLTHVALEGNALGTSLDLASMDRPTFLQTATFSEHDLASPVPL